MRTASSVFVLLCTAALAAGSCFAVDEIEYREGSRPPAAPGEVWCLVTLPAQYKTVSERCMVAPASCRYETIPAEYETRTERVCSKPECKRAIEVPAEYTTETYQECVKKASCRKECIPAAYEDREERVCTCEARTVKHT